MTPQDKELLAELRCASSSIVQLTARFMLEKHFGEANHREAYLGLLSTREDRDRAVAAIGLSATGEPADHALLLAQRLGAGPRARRRLLGAAASLDFANSRTAVFQDLGHPLCGVSNYARSLVVDRVNNADRSALESLLQSEHANVRRNALLVGARLGHWVALGLILRGHRDTDSDNVMLARRLLDGWLARHFHGIYWMPDPSQPEGAAVRVELARCSAEITEDLRDEIERALAGQSAP